MVASSKLKEIEMTTNNARKKLFAALAAIALATTLTGPAVAQTPAHSHDAHAPHKLSLNQGSKWATDQALREGMDRIRGLVEPRIGAAHGGALTPGQYRELAMQVETAVGGIVANCKLEPQADAMLHLVIAELGEGTDAMAGRKAEMGPGDGLAKVVLAVNGYGRHFDHPGFAPIHDGH